MAKTAHIHLGYEVATGKTIEIPLKHMCITGQTQESGKTTTLEALITRAELRAVAFITKRGEASFDSGRTIKPYFEERADWEFIESVLEAIMRQRMKFERAWIVKACKGAHTLADVQRNVAELQAKSKRSMDQDLFMLLGEYLKKVVPLIQRLPKAPAVELEAGLNVMDLRTYPEELQHLVISSTIRWIYQHEENVITIVPEAWKFAPQGRNTPVKVEIRRLAREGAGLKNYIWIDSQDIAGVEKEILRAAAVWLLGVQREANEIERALASIPKGIKRPKEGEIPRLKLGEFFACWGEHVHKVYVQPAWIGAPEAMDIAMGNHAELERQMEKRQKQLAERGEENMEDWRQRFEDERDRAERLQQQMIKMQQTIDELQGRLDEIITGGRAEKPAKVVATANSHKREYTAEESFSNEQLYQAFKERLMKESPALIKLLTFEPEIEVSIQRRTVSMSTDSLDGNVAALIHDGFFDEAKTNAQTVAELNRRGWKTIAPRVSDAFARFNKLGFLYQEGKSYQLVEGAKKHVVAA